MYLGRAFAAIIVLGFGVCAAPAQTVTDFTNAGGDSLWSNPANWSGGVVPINSSSETFVVRVGNARPSIDATMPASFVVDRIEASGSTGLPGVLIQNGRALTVNDESQFQRGADVRSGSSLTFLARSGGTSSLRGTFQVSGPGAAIRLAGTSYRRETGSQTTTSPAFLASSGGTIDLRSMTSMTFTRNFGASAFTGATIDWSGLTALTWEPEPFFPFVRASLNATDGFIRLDSLTTLANANLNGAGLSLPNLRVLSNSRIEGNPHLPAVTAMSDVQIRGAFTVPAGVSAIDSPNNDTWFAAGTSSSYLDGRSLTAIDLRDSSGGGGEGGGLPTLFGFGQIAAWAGGTVDLRNVNGSLSSTSSGLVIVESQLRGTVILGDITGSNISVLVKGGTARFKSLTAGVGSEFFASSGVSSELPHRFQFRDAFHNRLTDETKFTMTTATVAFDGAATAFMEVASLDAGAFTGVGTSGNFALGRLVLGEAGSPTTLVLQDLFDNGNRGTGSEALYLLGLDGSDALTLLNGSTLVIGDSIGVYFNHAGSLIDARSLFASGQSIVPYAGGFIAIPAPASAGLLALASLVTARRRRSY